MADLTEEDWEKFSRLMREFAIQWKLAQNRIADALGDVNKLFIQNQELLNKLTRAFYCPKCGHHKDEHDEVGCNHGRGGWSECVCNEKASAL